jgi:hypothetical protein
MAAAPQNPGAGAGAPPPQAAGAGPGPQVVAQFKQVAQQIQMLAQQYPEFSDLASQILPMLVKGLTLVSGNPARSTPAAAPPVGQ